MTGVYDLGGFDSYLGIQGFFFFCPHPPCFSGHGVDFSSLLLFLVESGPLAHVRN